MTNSRVRHPITKPEIQNTSGTAEDSKMDNGFDAFYCEAYPVLVRRLKSRFQVSPREAADDVAQEVMLAMYQSWKRCLHMEPGQRIAYMFGVASHKVQDHRRRQFRESNAGLTSFSLAELDDLVDRVASDDYEVLLSNVSIQSMLGVLPGRMRKVFGLHLAGHTPVEIAHNLRIAPTSVRNYISLGRKRLRKILESQDIT